MTLKDKLFSFEGRLRRQDWWVLGILVSMISFVFSEMIVITIMPEAGLFGGNYQQMNSPQATLLRIALGLLFWWPSLAMATKRRHDRDHSAKSYFVAAGAVTAVSVGSVVLPLAGVSLPAWSNWVELAIYMPVSLWMLIVLGILDGTQGPNRYGPSPKGLVGASEAVAEEFA